MLFAELRNASKKYGAVQALNDFNLQVRSGELVALLGPNGAGKTTAVRAMLGMTALASGTAELFGGNPRATAARQRTGVMLQADKMPETLRVREQIELFSSYYPAPMAMADVLAAAGLQSLADRLCGKLSGGERRRVAFALAICGNPDLLFLDEPTVSLDVESRRMFWSAIRAFVKRGGSVLLTTHYLEEADALADRIVVLKGGRALAEGTTAEVKARVALSVIRCATRLDMAALLQMPAVSRVRMDKQRTEIITPEPENVARELLARDRSLSGLEITASGLEEAFLTLTEQPEKAIAEVAR